MTEFAIPTLRTARLTLRGFTLADVEPLFRITNEPRYHAVLSRSEPARS